MYYLERMFRLVFIQNNFRQIFPNQFTMSIIKIIVHDTNHLSKQQTDSQTKKFINIFTEQLAALYLYYHYPN